MKLVGGPFCRFEYQPMNLNSSDQVKDYLYQHGWVPDTWNYKKNKNGFVEKDENGEPIKTSPQLTESSFHTVQGDVPKLLARRNILMHRKRLLKNVRGTDGEETGLLNSIRKDGRIEARAIPNATNTSRMVHKNIVNVPGVSAVYGAEFRNLFVVPSGYILLGCDAKGLEARCFAHYVYPYSGGPALADLLINGDIHQSNAELWGVTRKEAKAPMYCMMYGGQPPKLAHTVGCSLKEAKNIYDSFWGTYKPLTEFRDTLVSAWESRGGKSGGYLRAIDGRKLFARSQHSLVNLMFQSAGSIAVKYASVFADKWIKQKGLDCHQILFYHDELEYEVLEEDADKAKELVSDAFPAASKYLKFNVPLEGDAKLGKSWLDVH